MSEIEVTYGTATIRLEAMVDYGRVGSKERAVIYSSLDMIKAFEQVAATLGERLRIVADEPADGMPEVLNYSDDEGGDQ
jgi:hypothetical protein